jgi:single-stranded DNA-binding protein
MERRRNQAKQERTVRNMNRFVGVGRLPRNAVEVGKQKKVLRFTLATPNGQGRKGTYWAYVPCVVFKPSEELAARLALNGKGMVLALEGRVNTSRFEAKGQTRYSTEVIVEERSIHMVDEYANPKASAAQETDADLERLMHEPADIGEAPAAVDEGN